MQGYEMLDRPGGFDRAHLLEPLKQRDFRLLWTGMTVSLIGDGIFLHTSPSSCSAERSPTASSAGA
jgi:hypothetical protein